MLIIINMLFIIIIYYEKWHYHWKCYKARNRRRLWHIKV